MDLALGAVLIAVVMVYVGYPLFAPKAETSVEDVLEREIARRRRGSRTRGPAAGEDVICPQCGEANPSRNRFCGSCGAALAGRAQ